MRTVQPVAAEAVVVYPVLASGLMLKVPLDSPSSRRLQLQRLVGDLLRVHAEYWVLPLNEK